MGQCYTFVAITLDAICDLDEKCFEILAEVHMSEIKTVAKKGHTFQRPCVEGFRHFKLKTGNLNDEEAQGLVTGGYHDYSVAAEREAMKLCL